MEKIIKQIEEIYHNEALMIKAISQSRFDLVKEISDIAIKHKEDGHLSQENYNKRYEIEKELS